MNAKTDIFVSELLHKETESEAGWHLISFLREMGAEGGNIWYAVGIEKDD